MWLTWQIFLRKVPRYILEAFRGTQTGRTLPSEQKPRSSGVYYCECYLGLRDKPFLFAACGKPQEAQTSEKHCVDFRLGNWTRHDDAVGELEVSYASVGKLALTRTGNVVEEKMQ